MSTILILLCTAITLPGLSLFQSSMVKRDLRYINSYNGGFFLNKLGQHMLLTVNSNHSGFVLYDVNQKGYL